MCLAVELFGFILFETLCSLYLNVCFLSQVRKIFSYYFFKYVICPFFSLFSFWDPYNANVNMFGIVLKVS